MSQISTAPVPWRNWTGNQRAVAAVASPGSVDEVVAVVREAGATGRVVKPVGAGHSFSAVAHTDGVRVEPGNLTGLIEADPATRLVRVRAGTPLSALNEALHRHGLAMPNLGDIDTQTISGALATGTHGTGAAYGCLSTFVAGLELVTGTGDVVRCSATENPEIFAAARVGVGALGIVTEVTLRCVDAFNLRADERPVPLADLLAGLDEHVRANDHFEFYWMPYTDRTLAKRNNRVAADTAPRSAFRAWFDDHFLQNTAFNGIGLASRAVPALTPAMARGIARAFSPSVYTQRSDQVFTTPRRFRFMEMEYGLPREALGEAFDGLRKLIDGLSFKIALPVEVRFTAADDIWLSHGFGRENAYVAIHQYKGMPYEEYLKGFEAICAPLGGRPHWGKMHYRDAASLAAAYPRFGDFLAVRDALDPGRVFANAYTKQVFGP